jgi:diguanylate cyclase (GGDEF)-like protein/PAS domain S-box-containing protein
VRKHARIDLERLTERFADDRHNVATMVDSGFSSTLVIDLNCCILQWSRVAERFYGWRASEVIGRDVSIVVPADRRAELEIGLAVLRAGGDAEPIETVWRAKDGNDIYLRVQLSPFTDVEGRVVGACVFSFDNSETILTRDALMASEARYRALVAALTEFVLVTNNAGDVVSPQLSWNAYTGQHFDTCSGRGWLDALHPHDREDVSRQWVDGMRRAEPFAVSGRLLHESGEYRHCEGRVAPMRDGSGAIVEWVAALADVHQRHVAEERERQAADRFRRIFAANVFGVCYGEGQKILDANDAMLEMLGRTRTDLSVGIHVEDLLMPTEDDVVSSLGSGVATEVEVRMPNGGSSFVLAAGVNLEPGRGWLAVAVDVTERKAAERASEHRALHDPLTGLPNRRLLVDRLEHALARSIRQETLVGLLFCDLDHFKAINDDYGHAAGDSALVAVAQRLEGLLREGDTVARAGGDEFVVVLEDLAEPDDAGRIADRVRAALAQPVLFDDQPLRVTASIGVAISNGDTERVEGLLGRADDAMYRAKERGRDQIALGGDPGPRTERRWVEYHLKRALADGAFDLAFQPVIDLRDARPIGAEALLRWTVDGELIPTARAISVAEESGMITRVSDWVLRVACRQFIRWRALHPEAAGWRLHVNVSARDIADERFVQRVLDGIALGGCEPDDLCLEITETAMVHHPERAQASLTELRNAGLVVAIDDFGTGYASLGVLRDVPADIVKIDRSFVSELSNSARDRKIVEHAIDLAHGLGLVVVAEGVETLAQMAILEELGCDQAQGFAFARPSPVEHLHLSI